jgi:hypothetical protein
MARMASTDTASTPIRPGVRTAAFREGVARALAPLGFKALAQHMTLRRSPARGVVESVSFSASHHNGPHRAVCWIALVVTDKAVAQVCPGWQAGGGLGTDAFGDETSFDLAEEGRAEALLELVRKRTAFFELLQQPSAVLEAASRGPVPGLLKPRQIGPYLHLRLGPEAVARFAEELLAGRPELWPAFLGIVRGSMPPHPGDRLDHGSSLAVEALTRAPPGFARDLAARAPAGVVACEQPEAGHWRHHLGLQLRAWGEADQTPGIARLDDATVRALFERMCETRLPVDHPSHIERLLEALTGAPRTPRRAAPTPRYFQYDARADPWGRPSFDPL